MYVVVEDYNIIECVTKATILTHGISTAMLLNYKIILYLI